MAERLKLTPVEARFTLLNEMYSGPWSNIGHYSEEIAKALHPHDYRTGYYNPEYRSLKPEDLLQDAQRCQLFTERVDQALATLTDRERMELTLRFSLDGEGIRTFEEIGKEFGVTKERVRQINAKAFRKLRHLSRSKFLTEFLPENSLLVGMLGFVYSDFLL